MSSKSIIFRCDASLSIGSGHVMRCRTLARSLKQQGATVFFLCREQPGDLISLLRSEFTVFTLPALPLAPVVTDEGKPLTERELYAAWLGCPQEQDATDCWATLQATGIDSIDWLIVDHYGLDATWEQAMLTALGSHQRPHLLVIDDLADRPHLADCLLDQNFFGSATEQRYQGLVPGHCRQLLGPHYAILGPEYAQLHPLVPPRREIQRLLVFFGGVDPDNLTGRTLQALLAPEFDSLAVDVVLGWHSPHRAAVAAIASQRPRTTLHNPLPSLAGLISRADLAIGAGGATTWERACLGLPSLVVVVAANQLPFAQALHQAGYLQCLGETTTVSVEQIQVALQSCLRDQDLDPGQSLTDGWGVQRLTTVLLGSQQPLQLRLVTPADEALLLRWANDPQVRANSFSSAPISAADHHCWFQAALENPNRLQLIACDRQGCPLGQIRFDRNPDTNIAHIGFSLDRAVRGQGIASGLIRQSFQVLQQRWGPKIKAIAEVLQGNTASYKAFLRAGFTLEPHHATSPVIRLSWHPVTSLPSPTTS